MKEVAVIGAGLAGLCLALALHAQSIPCRVYEQRSRGYGSYSSSVVLSPNGLRVLDALGLYDRLKDKGYRYETSVFKNAAHETVDTHWNGHEKLYGFKALRLYRKILMEELQAACAERSIDVHYASAFDGIVEDGEDGVTFRVNGEQLRADMLVGADGIYSLVRKHISNVELQYVGTVALYVDIPAASVRYPTPDYDKACTLLGPAGSLLTIPCTPDASTLIAIRHFPYPDMSRDKWRALVKDKDKLADMIREGRETWHAMGQSVIDAMCANKKEIALWNFRAIPKLPSWTSATGRVVLVGDAAHAIPPSSGQGINQALEDVYALSLMLSPPASWTKLGMVLSAWHEWRQDRIDRLMKAGKAIQAKRMPLAEGQKVPPQAEDELRWLYQPNLKTEMQHLLESIS